jgi:hypothetical protein
MRIAVALLLLLAACPRTPTRALAQEDPSFQCQSSSECSHNSNGCTYCYQGACSCFLPAEPKAPSDAGTDTK